MTDLEQLFIVQAKEQFKSYKTDQEKLHKLNSVLAKQSIRCCPLCFEFYSFSSFTSNANRLTICLDCKRFRDLSRETSRVLADANTLSIKMKARMKLRKAVKSGKIKKPGKCSRCLRRLHSRSIQGHHLDYLRPLDVVWLCRPCHQKEHSLGKIENRENLILT